MEKKEEDELREAIMRREMDIIVAEKKLRLRKWTWRNGLKYSARLIDIVKGIAGANKGVDILNVDLSAFTDKGADEAGEIVAATIMPNNFDDLEKANAWIDELSMDEFTQLLKHIIEQNFRPLTLRLKDVLPNARKSASTVGLVAMEPLMSSRPSSGPASVKTPS